MAIKWNSKCEKLNLCIICDPMLDVYGPIAPALLVAKVMVEKKHDVSIISTKISDGVQKFLKTQSLRYIDLNAHTISRGGPPFSWLETWAREAFFDLNSRSFPPQDGIVINFSHTIAVPSTIWYAQGPTTDALKDMQYEFPLRYRFPYEILKSILTFADNRLTRLIASKSKFIIANSKFCASMYEERNIEVHKVIYPPLDCNAFKPTSTHSGDYVLTYFGKETDFCVLKEIGDAGVRIKAFGSKILFKPKKVFGHRNIEFLGEVSDKELVNLYSNALFTLFTFNHEPFGYIPVESMACGTPVLSFNRQGPSETVVNSVTGWLVNTHEEIIRLAVKLWRSGYSSTMRMNARRRALIFDIKDIAEEWSQIVEACIC